MASVSALCRVESIQGRKSERLSTLQRESFSRPNEQRKPIWTNHKGIEHNLKDDPLCNAYTNLNACRINPSTCNWYPIVFYINSQAFIRAKLMFVKTRSLLVVTFDSGGNRTSLNLGWNAMSFSLLLMVQNGFPLFSSNIRCHGLKLFWWSW